MFSLGDYKYGSDVTDETVTQNDGTVIGSSTLYLDGVMVGDGAQTTARGNLEISPSDSFKFNLSVFHADDIFGSINAEDFTEDGDTNMVLPSYELFDAGASYRFPLGDDMVYVRLNVNNIFDEEYYSESATNYVATDATTNYKGINVRNKVFPGWGRTWNLGFTYRF
jgi:outer membrane receptor protein involved in Fe transport